MAKGLAKGLLYGLLVGALIGGTLSIGYAAVMVFLLEKSVEISILGISTAGLTGMTGVGMAGAIGSVIGAQILGPVCALLGGATEAAKKRAQRPHDESPPPFIEPHIDGPLIQPKIHIEQPPPQVDMPDAQTPDAPRFNTPDAYRHAKRAVPLPANFSNRDYTPPAPGQAGR